MNERLALTAGDYRVELLPAAGGAIASLRWRHPERGWIDLMRPLADGGSAHDPYQLASFPLAPFANRVRDSQFTFRGRTVTLAPPPFGQHAQHGHALTQAWECAERTAGSASLSYRHVPDEWPFAYEITQNFVVSRQGLSIHLETRNCGAEPMPFGFGLHPYFPRTRLCRVKAQVSGLWQTDSEVMPTRHGLPDGPLDPRQGLAIDNIVCDNVFTGWNGRAVIAWPEFGTELTMSASRLLGVLFLYVPAAESYFCLEPASNITDAFNFAAKGAEGTGMIVLEPGQASGAEVTFSAAAI